MNRLISIRSKTLVHPYLNHSKTASASLRKFTTVKNVPRRGSRPITAPFGRGYGMPMKSGEQNPFLQNHSVPLGTASQQFMNSRHFAEKRVEKENKLLEDITKLIDDEIKSIGEFEEESIYADLGEDYLKKSGMKIIESSEEDKINLVGTTNNATFKVTFNREPDEDEDEPFEDEEAQEHEEEEGEEDLEETGEDQIEQHKQNMDIEITYATPEGKPKGQLLISAFAGKDNRLYIESMAVKKEREDQQPRMWFADLSDEMQSHIYQYLEKFQLDDDLARFVKQQVVRERSQEDIEFLTEFKSLIV